MTAATLIPAVLNLVAMLMLVVCCLLALESMSVRTRHCYRIVYCVIGVSAMALLLTPFYGVTVWTTGAQLALNMGFALYFLLDRRSIRRERMPADRAAVETGREIPQ